MAPSPASIDTLSVTLDMHTWLVITVRRLANSACPALHAVDVSDIHTLASQLVTPILMATLATDPKFAPCMVRLVDPVEGLLPCSPALIAAESTDTTPVRLALARPPVTVVLLLLRAAHPRRQSIDVSEIQSTASDPVLPSRLLSEAVRRATLTPSTVRLVDPVVSRFDTRQELSSKTSMLIAPETLPINRLAVTVTRRLLINPGPTRHTNPVSDTHVVPSQPLLPARADELVSQRPMLAECMVRLTDPVVAKFMRSNPLALIMSAEITAVWLRKSAPAVTASRLLPCTSAPHRQLIDESEIQPVASAAVPAPTVAPSVEPPSPIPAPATRMLTDPDPTTFILPAALIHPESADSNDEVLPH